MELQDFLNYMKSGRKVIAGSEVHLYMCMLSQEALKVTAKLNRSYHTPDEIRAIFSELTDRAVDKSLAIFPPFYTDFGKNFIVGKDVFFNSGCRVQDQGGVTIDDGVLIGHNVVLATLNHDLDPMPRHDLRPAPIHIGKNVWIGANATILPGVTVGDGAVVAAGAVVSKDVAANTVVGGVPARVIKNNIENEDFQDGRKIEFDQ